MESNTTTAAPPTTTKTTTTTTTNTKKQTATKTNTTQATTTKETCVLTPEVKTTLINEINDMITFALNNGIILNNKIISGLQTNTTEELLTIHSLLSQNVAPATPKSIFYLKYLNNQSRKGSALSRLPLVRNLIILAIFFLFAFVGTALSPDVNEVSLSKGIMNDQGWSLLLNLSFLCSISGLGVTFYLLKTVSKSIQKGTLNPEDAIYYTALIMLGLISGLILSEIMSLYSESNSVSMVNKSILALIGGFSSDAIFSIFQSFIIKIKSIFPSESA